MVSGWRFLTFPCGRTAQYATFVEEGGITLDLRDDTEINVSAKKGLTCYERARESTQRQNNQACRSCCPPLNNPAEHNLVLLIVLYDIWYTILLQAYHSGL